MLPVANRPILFYGLNQLKNAGIKEIGLVLGPSNERIRETVGDGSNFEVHITYIDQPEPKGIAHALLMAESFIKDDPVVVYLGDNLLKDDISPLVEEFRKKNWDELLLLSKTNDIAKRKRFGVAHLDKEGKVTKVIEKPMKHDDIASDLVMVGVYMFRSKVFEAVKSLKPSWRNELEITEAIQKLIDWNCRVATRVIKGWWKDTGMPEDILEANRLVLDEMKTEVHCPISKASLQGRVSLGVNTKIDETAKIRGPTIIGENTTLGANTYVGPFTSIGNNCIINNAEVENSIIMDNCVIDASERIEDSIIASHSRITSNTYPHQAKKLILGEMSRIEF
jgi:glucose-1-phosphate thymidylyltransferase